MMVYYENDNVLSPSVANISKAYERFRTLQVTVGSKCVI